MRQVQPDDSASLATLLEHASAGDEAAWRDLLDRYARRVFAMARSRCRSDELAEEIAQSVFATVAMKLTEGAYTEKGRFESWLFRVTMNRVRDEMRRRKRQAEPTDPATLHLEADSGPDAALHDESGEIGALREALGELSDADREIIELRHHAGLGFKQVAEVLGQPMGTVLARHHRALKKMKSLLESRGVTDASSFQEDES